MRPVKVVNIICFNFLTAKAFMKSGQTVEIDNAYTSLALLKFDLIDFLTKSGLLYFTAISNSFGFGGHNSVVAFTSFKP